MEKLSNSKYIVLAMSCCLLSLFSSAVVIGSNDSFIFVVFFGFIFTLTYINYLHFNLAKYVDYFEQSQKEKE